MVEPLAPRYDVLPREPLIQPPAPTGLYQPPPSEELRAKFRLGWLPQAIVRGRAADIPPDPSYHVWGDIAGYEQYAGALGSSRSKAETDALKAMIDRNRQDQLTASMGQLGLLGDLMAGVFDPVNLVPIPAVKGIGLVRGALRMGAATGALSTATEVARISADPTAEWSQMPGNIALATLLGGAIGAPVGAWGARAARRERAIRAFEADLGSHDSPQHALRPRGADEGTVYDYQRPPRNADGSYSRFKTVEEVRGYKPQTVDGVRYVSEDGVTWTTAADEGRAGPLSVSDDIAEQLGTPEPNLVRVQYVDEVAIKAEHAANGWHDELQSYVDGPTDIRRIVLDANDFVVFRHKQHQWEETLRPLDGETPQAFKERAGKEAMLEFRASKQTGDYAGFIGKVLGRLNFSPLAKLIRMVNGDNFVADLGLRTSGDYAWAIEGNRTRWSTPPSLLLKALRHTPRYKQFQDEFEAEWVKYASGNQSYGGRTFQGLNVSAAAYSLKRGFRRGGGANGMSHADFEEMVAEAIFTRGDFEVRGFPVNENARNAAKAFTRLAQEYDDLLRAAGAFRDQKNLTRDIAYWTKQRIYYQNRVMQWLWGETGQPANLLHAIRVNDRVFTGASHDEAVQNMVDALGDEGIALSEKLTPDSYGYTYREPTAPPLAELPTPRDPLLLAESDVPAVGEPAATVGRPSPEVTARIVPGEGPPPSAPPVQYDQFGNPVEMPPPPDLAAIEDPTGMAYDPAFEGFTTVGQALQHVIDSPYSPELKVVAERIMSFTRDVRMKVVHSLEPGERPDVEVPGDLYGRMLNEIMGLYSPGEIGGRVFVRGLGFGRRAAGASTVVHEALHSAAWDRVNQGLKEGASTPLGIAVGKLEDLRKTVTRHYMAEPGLLPDALREYQISNVHELISYGLSDRKFQDWLKSIRLDNGETGFTAFVKRIAALFGFGDDAQNALARVMQLADEVLPEANAPSVLQQQLDRNRARREALYPSLYRKKAEGPAAIEPTDQPAFISSEEQPTRLQGQSPAVRYKDEILYGYEHIDAVKALLAKGANSKIKSKTGKTAAEIAKDPVIVELLQAVTQ